MIVTIFGKKGSGKSVLSKQYMLQTGGRVIFLSPVEHLSIRHTEAWELSTISEFMQRQRPGDVLLVRLANIEACEMVCAQAIAHPAGYTIVIDEMDKYRASKQLTDAIHYSRHFDINIIANTRRYTDMPRLLTSQADELCVFTTQEPRDLEYLRYFTTPEFSNRVKTLPQFNYLHYPTNKVFKAKYLNI